MKSVSLILDSNFRYSNMFEQYFMMPNFLYDEGEFIHLSVHAKWAFGYMIRKANKRDQMNGKQDFIYFSYEELAKKCGFSISTAKKVTKELINEGYIKRVSTGSNLTGRANTYRMLYPYPRYEKGEEITINMAEKHIGQEELDVLLAKGVGKIYYYNQGDFYSNRKRLAYKLDTLTGEVLLHV